MTSRLRIKHVVVVVNYNGYQDTLNCLESISSCKDAPHIIVVDNGSTNDSVSILRSRYPDLDLITSTVNLGFSGGNNLGIERALKLGAKVVYLLNNDTLVDPNIFFRAYRTVSGKNRIAGAKIYYAPGSEYHPNQKGQGNIIWYAGGFFDQQQAIAKHRGVDEPDGGQYDRPQSTEFITGCFMAIPRQVVKKIGYFDERFFLYLEDLDYCLRATVNRIELSYNPSMILYHLNSGSSGAGSALVDYYLTRNRFLIAKRYGSWRLRFALLREALSRNWNNLLRRRALFDYLWGKMGNRNETISLYGAQTKN